MVQLFRVWKSLPSDRPRKAIDPMALGPSLLPHVSLGTFINDCSDFQYELISSELKEVAPRLKPGARSSDSFRIQNIKFDLIHDLFISTARNRQPRVLLVHYASMEGQPRRINTLFLPLGEQTTVDGVTCASDLMIGLWSEPSVEPLLQDTFEDVSTFFMSHPAVTQQVS